MPAYIVQYPARVGFPLPEGADSFVVFATNAANARAMAAGYFGGDADALMQSTAMTVTEVVVGALSEDTGYDVAMRAIGAADANGNVFVEAKSGESLSISGTDPVVAVGGTGYSVDDILTIVGGTFQRAATLRVITVSTGVITGIEVVDPGDYSVMPTLNTIVHTGASTNADLDVTEALAGSWAQIAGKLITKINALTGHAGAAIDLSETASGARLFTVSSIADGFGDATLTFEVRKNGVALPQLVSTIVDGGVAAAVLTVAIPASPLAPARVTPFKS